MLFSYLLCHLCIMRVLGYLLLLLRKVINIFVLVFRNNELSKYYFFPFIFLRITLHCIYLFPKYECFFQQCQRGQTLKEAS